MIFIFDLDHTLYNTSRLKKAMMASVRSFGIDEKLWLETYQAVIRKNRRGYDYDVKKHSRLLAKTVNASGALIEKKQLAVLKRGRRFLYRDAENFLKFLRAKKIKLFLLTLGNVEWQKEKISHLKITKYFDKIILTYLHKKYLKFDFPGPRNKWIFINDNPGEIKELKAIIKDSFFLRIKRKGDEKTYDKKRQIQVPAFPDLIKLRSYLQKNNLL